jgi:hypothetical protein
MMIPAIMVAIPMKIPETKAKSNVAKASQMPAKTMRPPILFFEEGYFINKAVIIAKIIMSAGPRMNLYGYW